MSAYNINTLSQERYYEEAQTILKSNFNDYYYDAHFKIGTGIEDFEKVEYAMIMSKLLCTDNCEIINYIQDKLEGRLENCPKKRKRKFPIIMKNFCEQECCNEEEAIEQLMLWSDVMW